MMNEKMKQMLSSYARSFVVAVLTAYAVGAMSIKELIIAGLIAVAGPAIRAVNPQDPAFGMVADAVDVELNKLAKAEMRKKKK
jgi:hypothetical protein